MGKKDNKSIDLANIEGEVLTADEVETREPLMYRVVLLNDDYTSMDFVIEILEKIFFKSHEEAESIMLNVHKEGQGLAGVFTKDVAETKIATVHVLARQNEFPLKCRLEPES